MVIRKSRRGPFLSCSGFPRCRNAMPTDKLEHLRELEDKGEIPDPPPPNAKGAAIIARRIAPYVKRLVEQRRSAKIDR